MGTWGAGNFDDDTAADHLSILTGRLRAEVGKAIDAGAGEIEPDEYGGVAVPCNVELLALIAEQRWVGTMLPSLEVAEAWKKKYLDVWDGYIDELEPSEEWKKERRAVLVQTFDRLLEQIRRREEPPAKKEPPPKKAPPPKKKAKKARAK
jgi:hypothetical protein